MPAPALQPAALSPSPAAAAVAAPAPAEPVRERSIGRFTARDYGYVKREILRIVIIALAMLVIVVVLSFFLP